VEATSTSPTFVKPPRLAPGDTVAAVSLSSGLASLFPHRYEAGKRQFEEAFGVRVVDAPHALEDDAWLRRNPEARADDLRWALTNPEVKGMISTIGGDDSVRLLPHLDPQLIRANPKVMMGFSDTTITLTAFLNAGVVAFHGPAFMTDLAENGGIVPTVEQSIRQTLFDAQPAPWQAAPSWTEEFLDWSDPANQARPRRFEANPGWRWLQGEGPVEGHVIGGSVEVLELLKGTPWWPRRELWQSAVLMLETTEEVPTPSMVERFVRNYGHQGILSEIAGMLLARPMGYTAEHIDELERRVREVLAEFGREEMPLVTGLDTGHTSPHVVVPLGCRVRVDPTSRTITSLEPAVADDDVTQRPGDRPPDR